MRFTCEKCGRAYAADERLRARSFRMRCKQCGNLILVPGTRRAGDTPAPGRGQLRAVEPAGPVEVVLEDGTTPGEAAPVPEPEDPFASLAAELALVPEGPPLLPDPTAGAPGPPGAGHGTSGSPGGSPGAGHGSGLGGPGAGHAGSGAGHTQPAGGHAAAPASARGEGRVRPEGFRPVPEPGEAPLGGPSSESEEVFAELARQMETATGSSPLHVSSGAVTPPRLTTPPPAPARRTPLPTAANPTRTRKWIAAILGLAAGVAGAGVAATVLAGRRSSPAPEVQVPSPPPAIEAVAAPRAGAPPVAAAEPARVAPPAPEPARPTPAAAPTAAPPAASARAKAAPHVARTAAPHAPAPKHAPPAPRRVAERAAEPAARPAAAPVRSAAPAPGPAPAPGAAPAPAPQAAAPAARGSERPLSEDQIQATIARHAGAFAGCAAQARRDEPQLVAEPRRVTVTMTVTPAGRVLYPTLDDQELSSSALGTCLKREAGRMSFPESGGEQVRVRMPLVLR